jgi:3-oxoacyl-[acyl-carrier-protein] synthase-1/3-oxoacyl-[acyl-carrier-protein] synthase II
MTSIGASGLRAFAVGLGVVTPAGGETVDALRAMELGARCLGPTSLFDTSAAGDLPVGEVALDTMSEAETNLPRTHVLALRAARQALAQAGVEVPDAIVLGATTGGIPTTEVLIKQGIEDPGRYRYHGTGSVAQHLAEALGCQGPALTLSTACSSGAVALKVALELIRQGRAVTVLAGGVDALCRLTYHGFNMLRLIDPEGTRPFDVARAGMTVGEGAAMMLLRGGTTPPEGALAELLGGGLSCDAYHPSAPHPEGRGALEAIRAALDDAGVAAQEIDAIALHGTGTVENDASEAKALVQLFGAKLPAHASVKGTFGHAVGAAGALGAAVATLSIVHGLVPANVGCREPDPRLGLDPNLTPREAILRCVLTNALGFGGNNCSLVLGVPGEGRISEATGVGGVETFTVLGESCLSGAGDLAATLEVLTRGERAAGVLDEESVIVGLPRRKLRRMKRLTKLSLSLAQDAVGSDGASEPASIYCGTCWGAVSELYDFLVRLYETEEQFSSPTDFVGTVHNAVAGHIALWHGSRGANVTTTAGDSSFEEALFLATLLADQRDPLLLLGLDQYHEVMSARLDSSHDRNTPADGGGALLLKPFYKDDKGPKLRILEFGPFGEKSLDRTIARLGSAGQIGSRYGTCWYGLPRASGSDQISILRDSLGSELPLWDLRSGLGQYATVNAAAVALAARVVRLGEVPAPLAGGTPVTLGERGILIIGLGQRVCAVEVMPE